MKFLFIGDIVGSPGRNMVEEYLPRLKRRYQPTVTIMNGENAAHGKGITEKIYKQLLQAGAQVITMGNHTWDNKNIFEFIDEAKMMIRPANYPAGVPGEGIKYLRINDQEVAVINLIGRTFMGNPNDDPFQKADELVTEASARTNFIFVDFHAETTSEKQAMGWFLSGRVSAIVGTHTHVQTADDRILDGGTAFLCDAGMTGPSDGILGMEREAIIRKFQTNLPTKFEVAEGREQLNGVVVKADPKTGKATTIERIRIDEAHPFFE